MDWPVAQVHYPDALPGRHDSAKQTRAGTISGQIRITRENEDATSVSDPQVIDLEPASFANIPVPTQSRACANSRSRQYRRYPHWRDPTRVPARARNLTQQQSRQPRYSRWRMSKKAARRPPVRIDPNLRTDVPRKVTRSSLFVALLFKCAICGRKPERIGCGEVESDRRAT